MTCSEAIEDVAQRIVRYLSTLTQGEPIITRDGLLTIAERTGCLIDPVTAGETSYYPDLRGDGSTPSGCIVLNIRDTQDPLRALLHELTHHLLAWWVHWKIRCDELLTYRIREWDIEERICHKVVELAFPTSVRFQWNGKLAIPELPPVLRRYRLKHVPGVRADEEAARS